MLCSYFMSKLYLKLTCFCSFVFCFYIENLILFWFFFCFFFQKWNLDYYFLFTV